MSKCHYIGYINKRDYHIIKKYTIDDINKCCIKLDDFIDISQLPIEILTDISDNIIRKTPEYLFGKFFDDSKSEEYLSQINKIKIISKDFITNIIDIMRSDICTYYDNLLSDEIFNTTKLTKPIKEDIFKRLENIDRFSIVKILECVREMAWIWDKEYGNPYNIDIEDDRVILTSRYEYKIFELVRIYKTFNWNENVMIYYYI